MRVLLTGMTAQQANPASHDRAANYTGFLKKVLETGEHEVDWRNPEIDLDLVDYDYVVVGVAPITSLGANRAYGALSIIERLWDSDKLTLLIDAPEPGKIDSSLQAIMEKPENLTKPFFSYRKEYENAALDGNHERLLKCVKWLHEKHWPRTIVPALPWHTKHVLETQVPRGARSTITGGELERFVLEEFGDTDGQLPKVPKEIWAYESGSDKKWRDRQGLSWDDVPIPWSSRSEADAQAINMIRECAGTLIAPQRSGTWWNTRYAMSLAQGRPVFTEWQESATIGSAWAVLPQVFENITPKQRAELAVEQFRQYTEVIQSRDETIAHIEAILMGEDL